MMGVIGMIFLHDFGIGAIYRILVAGKFIKWIYLDLKMASVKINDVVKITNRGHALIGNIIEGDFSAGDLIQLSFTGSLITLEIKSIESVRSKGRGSEIGLMLGIVSENIKNTLEAMIGQTVTTLKGH